jgi:hypothetical protein
MTAESARMNLVVYDAKDEELSSIDLHCTRWESKAGKYVSGWATTDNKAFGGVGLHCVRCGHSKNSLRSECLMAITNRR